MPPGSGVSTPLRGEKLRLGPLPTGYKLGTAPPQRVPLTSPNCDFLEYYNHFGQSLVKGCEDDAATCSLCD